jgi:hypothetical protein
MKVELGKLKLEIEQNYSADIAAVNQLLKSCAARQEIVKKITSFARASNPQRSSSQIIEELIRKTDGEFDISTIEDGVQALGRGTRHTRRIISQVINMLRQRNPPEIVVVPGKEGKGRRGGTYMRAIN